MQGLIDYLTLLKYGAEFAIAGCVLVVVLIIMVGVALAKLARIERSMATLPARPPLLNLPPDRNRA